MLTKRIVKKLKRLIYRSIPYNRFGDRIFLYLRFIEVHHRKPGKDWYFNDYLYNFFTSSDVMNPARHFTSDKELSKVFAAGILKKDVAVPTLAVLRSEEEILKYAFPRRCVIKGTHAAGMTIVRTDGEDVDTQLVCSWLRKNYYQQSREVNYKFLTPKIIVEPILFDGGPVDDYKIFCGNGQARCLMFVSDRFKNFGRAFFDLCWNEVDINIKHPISGPIPPKPECWDEVVSMTNKLAEQFGFVRIDWFINGKEFYLGEISHGHMCGLEVFPGLEDEKKLGALVFQ